MISCDSQRIARYHICPLSSSPPASLAEEADGLDGEVAVFGGVVGVVQEGDGHRVLTGGEGDLSLEIVGNAAKKGA